MLVRTEADGPIVENRKESKAPWLSNSFRKEENNDITFGGEPYCPPDVIGGGDSDDDDSNDDSNVAFLTSNNQQQHLKNHSSLSSDISETRHSMTLIDIEANHTHQSTHNETASNDEKEQEHSSDHHQKSRWQHWTSEQNINEWKTSARNVAGNAYTRVSNIDVPETLSENISNKAQNVTNLLKDKSSTWKHLLFIYIVMFMTFIIACVGVRTSSPSSPTNDSSSSSSSGCAHSADLLWGDPVYTLDDGRAYQVVGGDGDGLTWKEASFDAGTRCYRGKTGSLVAIESSDLNDMLHRYLYGLGGDDDVSGVSNIPSAWIGGIELSSSSSSTSYGWVTFGAGGTGLLKSTTFWTGDEDGSSNGAYVNWRLNEPVSSEESELMGGETLGCVEMDGVSGFWNTASCMSTRPYFLVQFT